MWRADLHFIILTTSSDGDVLKRPLFASELFDTRDIVPQRAEKATVFLLHLQLQPFAGAVTWQRIFVDHPETNELTAKQ